MNCLPVVFAMMTLAMGSQTPWYPLMVPMHAGGHHHHHTTHIVTHPVTHTRFLVLGDDDYHHHRHNYGHNHPHKHGHGHKQGQHHKRDNQHFQHASPSHHYQQRKVHGRSNALQTSKNVPNVRHNEHGYHSDEDGYSNEEDEYDDHYVNRYSDPEPIKYSVPVSESPWKPIHYLPRGYMPLKHLGLDEERVSAVVRQALSEIEDDMKRKPNFISPISSKSYIESPLRPPKSLHRGAVHYYAHDGKQANTHLRYGAGSYEYKNPVSTKSSKYFKLNIECKCEDPDA